MTDLQARKTKLIKMVTTDFDSNSDSLDDVEDSYLAKLLNRPTPPKIIAGDWDFQNDQLYFDCFQQSQQEKETRKAEQERRQQLLKEAEAEARARAETEFANRQRPTVKPTPVPVANVAPALVRTPEPSRNNPSRPVVRSNSNKGEVVAASTSLPPIEYPYINVRDIPPVAFEFIEDNFTLETAIDLLMHAPVISVDTETNGLDPFDSKLLLVQVASPEKCYVIDATKVNIGPLKRLLENEHILKLLQNAKFDYKMLKEKAGIELNTVFDTYLAEKLLTAGTGATCRLDDLVERHLHQKMDKSVRKTFYGQAHATMTAEQLAYAAKDVMALFPIYALQLNALKKEKLLSVADLEFRCVMSVGDLELNGCLLDVVKWRSILADVAKKRDDVRKELMEILPGGDTQQTSMFGGPEYLINLNSGQQIIAKFKEIGIELEDTSEATLSKHDHPAAKKLLEYRGHEKTIGSFGESLLERIHKKTGRIHPDFLQYGADTGRFSCTNPNVQQIPATSDFRSCFIPAPGYKLVTSDYSQAELRILAQLSLDAGFVGAFQSGGDLHILAASQMFQVPIDQVTKTMRSQAKAINFGLAYGMGPQGLALRIDKTVDEARELIDQYFKAFSGVQKWLEKMGRDSVRKGYADTPLGRKRYFQMVDRDDPEYRRKASEIERRGKNAPIQGCVVGSTRIFEETTGYVAIEKLCNQVVSIWDGELFSKAFVVYSGKKQLVKIQLWGGHYIECSPDHRFLTRGTSGKDVWKTPAQFKAQDRIVLTENLPDWANEVSFPDHNCEGSWNAKKDISLAQITNKSELGEWLGRLASDGSVADGCVRLLIAEHEEAILPQLQAVSNQLGYTSHSEIVRENRNQVLHKLTVSSRGLVQQVRELGVKERVPDCAWQDSRILAGYLRGMFDGDGTVHPDGAILTFGKGTTHLKWAREIQEALLLFGVRSRLNVYDYRINLCILKKDMPTFCEKIGFTNQSKQAKAQEIMADVKTCKIYGRAIRVQSVEVTNEWVDMYDVVNSDTGRFMANGIVVHNCNADMTKMALVFLREKLKGYDARIVNTVHDEIVVEVVENEAEVVCKIVEAEMIRAGQEVLKDIPVVADAKVGDYWSK